MNLKKKLESLGPRFKVPRNGMDLMKWSTEVKRAANWSDSIDLLYAREFGGTSAPTKLIEGKAVEVVETKTPPAKTEVQPPLVAGTTSHSVDVRSPVFNVTIPPPDISVHSAKIVPSWVDTAERLGSHSFTFFAGLLAGVLVGGKVLKLLGVVG